MMSMGSIHFFPLTLPFILAFVFLIGIVIALIEIGIIQYAYVKIGVSRRHVFAVLVLALLGSYINIPVAELPAERMIADREITFFGMQYVVPLVEEVPRTVIAVNVGGAIIPALLSFYLIVKKRMYGRTLVAVAVVTAVVHWMAYPVEGVGIAVPIFIPPLVAAGIALLLARQSAPSLAYISGSLG